MMNKRPDGKSKFYALLNILLDFAGSAFPIGKFILSPSKYESGSLNNTCAIYTSTNVLSTKKAPNRS